MRHLKRTAKLGRTSEHRNMMLANLVCSLIKHKRVTTTLAKAKAARPVAEKMVTLGKSGTLHDRRLAAARLHQQTRSQHETKEAREKWRANEDVVRILFDEIAPVFKDRRGGYTRILKLGQRQGDAANLAILEWVELPVAEATSATTEAPATETKEAKVTEAKPKRARKKKAASETEEAKA
ncbi:MAG: 50S ribosomal protein L17 [Verrucomicrobia bacterium]|nr:50S ribosomal protein L17 [Verrucomicrobiota bacterium]